MKKILSLIFVALFAITLNACGETTTAETTNNVTTADVSTTVDDTTTAEVTTSAEVTTEAPTKELASIEITNDPTKIVYDDQEDFDSTGVIVTAHYDWSNSTTTTADVTGSVTYDKTTLDLNDDGVNVSYTEGDVTVTTAIAVTVNPTGELIGGGITLGETPISDLEITVESTHGDATSYWYTEYHADVFYIKAVVVDDSVEEGDNLYNADGIEVFLYGTERNSGLINGTININASVAGDLAVRVATDGSFVDVASTTITAEATKVSFDGRYVAGYQIEIEIPYAELGLSAMEQVLAFVPGLYNNEGAYSQVGYAEDFSSNTEETHTYIFVSDDNTYANHPWLDLGYTDGWVFETENILNAAGGEQSFDIEGAYGTTFATSLDLNISAVLNDDAFPKAGIALTSENKTVFFFIDVNATLDNQWGNYVVRAAGEDWAWGDIGARQYLFLGDAPYNGDNYKTLEIVRVGTSIYLISGGRIVQYVEGIFAEDEATQVSVMGFNMNMKVQNMNVFDATSLETEMTTYQIAAKEGSAIDGNIADWDATVLANAFHIYGTNGRVITIYTHMAEDGVYIAYDALYSNALINDQGDWWMNTNVEFRLGLGEQRFSSANGSYSRYENWGGNPRDIGASVWATDVQGNFNHSVIEMFIPWGMIEGYDSNSDFVPAGFAWKNPGEEGSIWAGGDFWYVPEADPGLKNVLITSVGIYQAQDLTVDGSTDDWDSTILDTAWIGDPGDGRSISSVAYVGTDGLYGVFTVTTPDSLNLINTSVNWWENPNIEIWANDMHSRIMIYDGTLSATGFVNQAAYVYDDATKTLTIEFFISFHSIGLTEAPASIAYRIGSSSLNGGWFMPVDPNQDVTIAGLPVQP